MIGLIMSFNIDNSMRKSFIPILLIVFSFVGQSQEFMSYKTAIEKSIFSNSLNDSVEIEISFPEGISGSEGISYPVIYLLDKQSEINFRYNLRTIDYLTTMGAMPKSIVVGILFNWHNRDKWTNPNASGGRADDLITFLTEELQEELKIYSPSSFNLLVGHSRTAIFSSYALSKRPDFFNGAIASSVANFDFGDKLQQDQFEHFISSIDSSSHKYFFYFSVGEELYGDLHEESVDSLNAYLQRTILPANFQWEYYKYKVGHMLTPGLTVNRSLAQIFTEYGNRVEKCFTILNNPIYADSIPWAKYLNVYETISKDLGYRVQPSDFFYNSIASGYYNDYDGIFKENNLLLTLEILLKAIDSYPNDYSYCAWVAEIYFDLDDEIKGEYFMNAALELINNDSSLSEETRMELVEEVNQLKQ